MSESLQISRQGRLLCVTLNRPEKRNALNLEICRGLVDTLEAANQDADTGAILLTGKGKAFSAGMDLSEILNTHTGEVSRWQNRLFTAFRWLKKPLVAYVHGPALAGGTGLAANAHVVIASEEATFGLTEIRIALWPFLIFPAMEHAVGHRRATELALTGRIIGAGEAVAIGLAHRIGGDAVEMARAIANASPVAIETGLTATDPMAAREVVFQSPQFRSAIERFTRSSR